MIDLEDIHDFAVAVALRAGALLRRSARQSALLSRAGMSSKVQMKSSEVDLVTDMDVQVEELIRTEIQSRWPDDDIVAEESEGKRAGAKAKWHRGKVSIAKVGRRFGAGILTASHQWQGPTWHVDPLDGTLNYAHSLQLHCISIGFSCSHETLGVEALDDALVGVIYAPCPLPIGRQAKRLPRAELGARRFLGVRACIASDQLSESPVESQERVVREIWKRSEGLNYRRDGVHYDVEMEKDDESRSKASSSVRTWSDPLRERKRLTREEAHAQALQVNGGDKEAEGTFGGRLLDEGKDQWSHNACVVWKDDDSALTCLYPISSAQAPHTRILEVGCGAEAVSVVKSNPLYAEPACGTCKASVWDLTSALPDGSPSIPSDIAPHSLDIVVLIFVLSALHPNEWQRAIANVRHLLKTDGIVLVRDYGRHDLPQVRFGKGRMMDDNFYGELGACQPTSMR
ncbi:hypothetical protein L7F22_063414 [Adiantum nelumboides]|nr:hypothetical protein [Adiantum nelumboides]